MLSFNGLVCEYDKLGNPTKYKGKTLTWDNLRTLKTYDNVSFTYDKNGIRTSKTITTTETDDEGVETTTVVTKKFYLNGNKIIMQDNGDADTNSGVNSKLFFHYGANGVTGFTYRKNKTTFVDYFYKKNAQGDIVGIYDYTGKEVVKYYYDAWGNHKAYYTISGTSWYELKDTDNYTYAIIARVNPFRYRGYYYDTETNLYYLNSRYYDPETGRFINADDISVLDSTKSIINGLNLYAYCLNNPVNETDESGYLIFSLFLAFLIGSFVSAAASTITQGLINGFNNINFGIVILDTIMGGIGSIISMSPIGIVGQMALGGLMSTLQYIGGQLITKQEISNRGVLFSLGLGTIFSASDGVLYGKMFKKQIQKTVFVNQIEKQTLSMISKKGLSSGLNYFTKHIGDKIIKGFAKDTVNSYVYTSLINIVYEYLNKFVGNLF